MPLVYKGLRLECGYRFALVDEERVVLEIKAVDALHPIHEAQLLTSLKLSGIPVGLVINVSVPVLKDGIMRRVL